MVSNACGDLTFHKSSVKGTVRDYVITLRDKQQKHVQSMMEEACDLFTHLIEQQQEGVLVRLVAKVNFIHMVDEDQSLRSYHFPSYQAEPVVHFRDFFIRHMLKIAQRLDAFHHEGSHLLLPNIEHIHILLTHRSCL